VQKALDMSETWWKSMPERQGFEVILTKDLMSDCFVQGEENELLEVVINLVKNAVEAMPQGGEIIVRASCEGKNALLTVEDNGVGIPEPDLGRIFEPFFTTKGVHGTGMGLASAYGIILRHGGQISAHRREGGGTRFSVRIPLAGDIREAKPKVRADVPQRLRVLVIDDQEPIVAMLEQLFARRGHTVLTALSGQEGLNIFEHFPVDVVISDLSMPSMTGWQVGKAIKDLCLERGIPRPLFLILTGWGNRPEDSDLGVEAGIDGILEKPVNFERLMGKIRELFHERECLSISHDTMGAGLY
jgi:CheY-like chemotaxis protein